MSHAFRDAVYSNLNQAYHNNPTYFHSTVTAYCAKWREASAEEVVQDMIACTDISERFPSGLIALAKSYVAQWQRTLP